MGAGAGQALLDAVEDLIESLAGAGVGAALDPDSVPIPGAWVSPRTLDLTGDGATLAGGGTAAVHLYLVASDSGEESYVLATLAGLLDKVLPLVTLGDLEDIDVGSSLSLPTGIVPAFRLQITLDI